MTENYGPEAFTSPVKVCDAPRDFSRFSEELKALEPFGVGNKKPMFEAALEKATLKPAKEGATYCSFYSGDMDYMYFGGERFSTLIESSAPKTIVFECDSHSFKGRDYTSGIVRYLGCEGEPTEEEAELSALRALSQEGKKKPERISAEDAQAMLDNAKTLGTIFIAQDKETLSHYSTKLPIQYFAPSGASLETALLVSPQWDLDLTGYREIVFLDDIEACPYRADGEVYSTDIVPAWTKKIETERETLLGHFAILKRYAHRFVGADPYKACREIKELPPLQAAFDLEVFSEMGLIIFSSSEIVFRSGKSRLENSRTYLKVRNYDASSKDTN